MRKFLTITIPLVTLALFILIMLSNDVLKKSFGNNDNFPKAIEELITDINNGRWEEVRTETEELEKTWRKLVKRIQYSSERDEMNDISRNIARLRGAAMSEDKINALIELSEARDHWKEIGK